MTPFDTLEGWSQKPASIFVKHIRLLPEGSFLERSANLGNLINKTIDPINFKN